ncbi:MAG: hypothetical protein IJZ66_09055 [Oscillibacter sp.]|nr:hypothetical protein [Oscillibacter sp.]
MMEHLFEAYLDTSGAGSAPISPSQASKWLAGKRPIPKAIADYYAIHTDQLAQAIYDHMTPYMLDGQRMVAVLHDMLARDPDISGDMRATLSANYPCGAPEEIAAFTADLMAYAMQRRFDEDVWYAYPPATPDDAARYALHLWLSVDAVPSSTPVPVTGTLEVVHQPQKVRHSAAASQALPLS